MNVVQSRPIIYANDFQPFDLFGNGFFHKQFAVDCVFCKIGNQFGNHYVYFCQSVRCKADRCRNSVNFFFQDGEITSVRRIQAMINFFNHFSTL